jgi:hypothetical protein
MFRLVSAIFFCELGISVYMASPLILFSVGLQAKTMFL